ncbi:MAG: tetratricopeptide repeat protein [Pirellulales bacterium]|nr:tetratricopeptide repeat protein [Pirellulales bacterium]
MAAGHYARGRWALAVDEFTVFLDRFPSDAKASDGRFFLAEALLQDDRVEEAAARYADYLRRAPDGRFARTAAFRAGEAAYLAGRLDEAQHALSTFHEAHPDDSLDAYALGYLGQISLARHDASTAAGHFRDALRKTPEGPLHRGCRLGLARSLETLGKPQEALEHYKALSADGSDSVSAEARFRLGGLQYLLGECQQAIATLKPLDGDPTATIWQSRARLVRALALRKLGRLDEAAPLLTELAADPAVEVESQYWLAAVRKDQRQWDEAARILRATAEKHPDHGWMPAIRFHAGHALLMAGKPAEAAEQFDLVLGQTSGENTWLDDALLGKIHVALTQKDAASVDRLAGEFLQRFPDSPLANDARRIWAGSLSARGEDAQSVELLNASLAADPAGKSMVESTAQLAVGLARLGKWEPAKAKLETLLVDHADHAVTAAAVEQAAEAAYAAGNWTAAAEWFDWLAGRDGSKAEVDRALSGLAWTQFKQGRLDESAATFARLLDRKPDAPLAVQAAWARGYLLEQLEQLDAALAAYRPWLDESPQTEGAANLMLAAARLLVRLERPGEAAALYERLATEEPTPAELDAILHEWSGALASAKRPDEAADVLARLHQEFPKGPHGADAAYRLAERAAAAGDRAAARRLLDEALDGKTPPEVEPYALALACRLDADDERWDDVARSAQRLLDAYPQSELCLTARFWLAESLYRRGQHEAAAEQFDKLLPEARLRRETWMAMIPLRRAQILALEKKWTEAHDLASTIEGDFAGFDRQYEVDYLLGRCLAARAEFEAAREAYRRAVNSTQGSATETAAMAQWMIGETHFHQKNHEAAAREYLRVEILYAFPRWQAAALLQAGKCYEQLGRTDEAAELYRRLAREYPVSPFVDEANKRLSTAGQSTNKSATVTKRTATMSR